MFRNISAPLAMLIESDALIITYLAEVVRTLGSDGLIEQFLTADTLKQLAHLLHEFLTSAHH